MRIGNGTGRGRRGGNATPKIAGRDGAGGPWPSVCAVMRSWRRCRLLASLFIALSMAMWEAPALAQSTTLVSNIGQANGGGSNLTHDIAQAFTTGDNSLGYTLTGVDIVMPTVIGTPSYSVSIFTDSSGSPGTIVGTALTNPSSFATGQNAFTHTGIDLAANTTYFVFIDSLVSNTSLIRSTNSDNQDTGAASGWSIADTSLQRDWNVSAWESANSWSRKIRIKGTAKSPPPPPPTCTTSGANELWCGNVAAATVQAQVGGSYFRGGNGYIHADHPHALSDGSISDDEFDISGTTYTVWRVTFDTGGGNTTDVRFTVATGATLAVTELPDAADLSLEITDTGSTPNVTWTHALSDATYTATGTESAGYVWTNATRPSGFNYNSGSSYTAKLIRTTADTTAPTVTSIVRQSPTTSSTGEDSLTWRVTFSEAVKNVGAADFTVTGPTNATLAVVAVTGSSLAYDVTASGGDLASLDATVTLSFASTHDIKDNADNALANTTPTGTNENTFVVDNTTPPPPAHCDPSDEFEMWCANVMVGTATLGGNPTFYGFSVAALSSDLLNPNRVGSAVPETFSYRGVNISVIDLFYGGTSNNLQFKIGSSERSGGDLLGTRNFSLEIGTGANKKTFAIESTGTEVSFEFPGHGLSWTDGQTVPVKLVRVPPPPELAHCNSMDPAELWCGSLTVGQGRYVQGYIQRYEGGRLGSLTGSLDSNSFSHDGQTYTIEHLRLKIGAVSIKFSPDGRNMLSTVETKLIVGGKEFLLNRAQHRGTGGSYYTERDGFYWGGDVRWRSGDVIPVKLIASPLSNDMVLVSNLEKRVTSARNLAWLDHGQQFTTGRHAAGYAITSVDVALHNVFNNGNFPDVFIRSGSAASTTSTDAMGNSVTNQVATLTKPTSGAVGGDKIYRYTATGVTLAAETDYWVIFSNGSAHVRKTGIIGVSSRADSNWNIAPTTARRFRPSNHPGCKACDWEDHGRSSTSMRVNGSPASGSQTQVEPPTVDGTPSIGGSGGDGSWDEGDTVEVTVTFSEAVNVDTTDGTPSVEVFLGSPAETRSAVYTGGHGTTELVFEYTLVAGDGSHRSAGVTFDSLSAGGGTIQSVATGADAALTHNGAAEFAPQAPEVRFEDVPGDHDGATPFTVRLSFSGPPQGLTPARDAANVVEVAGGRMTAAQAGAGSNTDWLITIDPDGNADIEVSVPARECTETNAVCIDGQSLGQDAEATIQANVPATISASWSQLPGDHDGTEKFSVHLDFNAEPVNFSYRALAASIVSVEGGAISGVGRRGRSQSSRWRVDVVPSGTGPITLTVNATTDCNATHAACNAEGHRLEGGAQAVIQGPEAGNANVPEPDPISASWSQLPGEHDGSTKFSVHLDFSAEPANFSYRALAASIVSVEGGAISGVGRRGRSQSSRWRVDVVPSGTGQITLTVNATTDCSATHAACTAAGGMLEGGAQATILGPAMLSVADAEVEEADGATLDFVVSLSRRRSGATTVDYATSDGTAVTGDDYTATSGTLTFAANETEKTVSVPVLNDAHDEGSETLTLTLSNPVGAQIEDATATGTITNTDAMPQAWIARFGRTVADQVIDAVEGRMRAARRPGAEVVLGGQRIGLGGLFGAGGERPSGDAPAGDGAGDGEARKAAVLAEAERAAANLAVWLSGGAPGSPSGAGPEWPSGAGTEWPSGAGPEWPSGTGPGSGSGSGDPEEAGHRGRGRTTSGHELLLGSSFSVTAQAADKSLVSLWGRGAVTRFDGREGGLSLDGEVASAMLGADWSRGRWTTGLIVGRSVGEGGYRDGESAGTVKATLTGLYPWLRHALSKRLEVWGAAGYGLGSLTLTPEGQSAIRTDLDLWMAAAGLRGTLLDGGDDGLTLTGKTDAMTVGTSTDAVSGSGGNLAAAKAEVTRLRLGLEGARPVRLADGSVLTPGFEIGVRHDGGDAESGFGADIGASLSWSDPKRGLAAELRGRGLLAHEAKGFRERGLSGSFSWEPVSGGRGPRLSLTQTLGGASSGGTDALLSRTTLDGLAANSGSGSGSDDLKARRLELKLGYGFAAFGDRFTFTPEAGMGLSDTGRDYSLGWRLVRRSLPGGIGALELSFEAQRRESANDNADPEHEVGLRLSARF